MLGQEPTFPVFPDVQNILQGPFYHPDPMIDLAIIKLETSKNLAVLAGL